MRPIVQISLDLTSIPEALETAKMAMRAGVDWLEAGTPLIIAEGMRGVRELRAAFPDTPIVADLKTMDGGWLEAELMAKAGASMVVVMGQAHIETVELVVRAGKDFGVKVMGDNLGMPEAVAGARLLAEAGCDYIIHHIAFDLRTLWKERGRAVPSPLDQLHSVVETPKYGAPLVVIGAPLAIDPSSFRTASGNVERALRQICEKVHAYGDIPVGMERRS
jgi:3-hexulose-6-phosphate synthase